MSVYCHNITKHLVFARLLETYLFGTSTHESRQAHSFELVLYFSRCDMVLPSQIIVIIFS